MPDRHAERSDLQPPRLDLSGQSQRFLAGAAGPRRGTVPPLPQHRDPCDAGQWRLLQPPRHRAGDPQLRPDAGSGTLAAGGTALSAAAGAKTVLITGATGGIGGALADAYAEPGATLILHGRNAARLAELAAFCEGKGARVLTEAFDIRDRDLLFAWLARVCETEAVDLAIANAGVNINIGADGEGERWAALKAYGEALRGWLAGEGIRINVVMPGYVESAMCEAMPGPKPFLWPAERAARTIRRALAADRARITFPFPLDLGCWFLSVLPPETSRRILRWLDYGA